ncbi:MAG: GDSL-type esterase/lipase family protein [Acidobacteriota bacterium]|nr:GDSL-type esterase/lipase family protein [Acidobacteriota bacterium]
MSLLLTFVVFALGALGCGGEAQSPATQSTTNPPPANQSPATPSTASSETPSAMADSSAAVDSEPAPVRIVVLGDSLAAGLSLEEEQAFPALVEEALVEQGLDVEVINAGVSGDTSAGGLRRLDWMLRQDPDIVVVELGGNDGLRGLPVEETESNLRGIIQRSQQAGARVLLTGMQIPSNYGPEYTEKFTAVYPRLAEELDVALMPFLLEGVALDPTLNLPDRIHPNPAGHRIIAENLLPYLEPLVREELGEE